MTQDTLKEQAYNEINAALKAINKKYTGFYHFKVYTIVSMDESACIDCPNQAEECLRVVVSETDESKGGE